MNLQTEQARIEEAQELLDDIRMVQNQVKHINDSIRICTRLNFNPDRVERNKRKVRRLEAIEQGLIERYLETIKIK